MISQVNIRNALWCCKNLARIRTKTNVLATRQFTRTNAHFSEIKPDMDKPVVFSKSIASQWKAEYTRTGKQHMPPSQPYVVVLSVGIFLLYFCYLREENDVDQSMERTLYDHIEGLEEAQLIQSYNYNKEKGLDTTDIEKRLSELRKLK